MPLADRASNGFFLMLGDEGCVPANEPGVCRKLLEAEKAPAGCGAAVLQDRLRRTVCNRVLASLPAVLNRARLLAPREQVPDFFHSC